MTVDSRPKMPMTDVSGTTPHQISASMAVINLYCEHLLCHLEQLSTQQTASFIENIQTQLLLINTLLEEILQPVALWRASAQTVQSGEVRRFASLEDLFAFLEANTNADQATEAGSENQLL